MLTANKRHYVHTKNAIQYLIIMAVHTEPWSTCTGTLLSNFVASRGPTLLLEQKEWNRVVWSWSQLLVCTCNPMISMSNGFSFVSTTICQWCQNLPASHTIPILKTYTIQLPCTCVLILLVCILNIYKIICFFWLLRTQLKSFYYYQFLDTVHL